MKQWWILLLVGTCVCSSFHAYSQDVAIPIPKDAIVINSSGALERVNNRTYWLCNSGAVQIRGTGHTLFVDQNSAVDLEGNSNLVYSISSSSISIRGSNNQIHTAGASLTVNGDNNVVYAPGSAAISLTGKSNVRNPIGHIVFDYAGSGSTGCSVSPGLEADTAIQLTGVRPNPARTGSTIRLEPQYTTPASTVSLIDNHGRAFLTFPAGTREFPLLLVPVGNYTLRYEQPDGQVNLLVIVGL